jgi:hypothetical protein
MTTEEQPRACGVDRGREAVYAAEEATFGGTELEDRCAFSELVVVAANVVRGEWWREAGGPPVEVVAARADARSSSARADPDNVAIRLAAGQLDKATLAHELAHVLAGVDHGHDDRFRAAHVDVVAVLAGSAPAAVLAGSYAAFGLVVGPRAWPPPTRGSGNSFVIVP